MTTISEHIQKRARMFVVGTNTIVKLGIGVTVIVLIAMMFPHGESIEYSFSVGTVWTDNDLVAPFSFPIYKDFRAYERERQEAAKSVYPVFERDEAMVRIQSENLHSLWKQLRVAGDAHRRVMKSSAKNDSIAFQQASVDLPITPSDNEWQAITTLAARGDKFEQSMNTILSDLLREGVLDQPRLRQSDTVIALRKGRSETIVFVGNVLTLDEAFVTIDQRIRETFKESSAEVVGSLIVRAVLKPNLILNEQATNEAVHIAVDNVPRTLGYVLERETVIHKNDRITEDAKLKLDSYEKAKVDRSSQHNEWQHWVGIMLHIMLLVGIFGVYLFLFRKRVFRDNGKLTIIALVLLMETFFAYLSLQVTLTEPVQYLIFVPAASMLLTIIFDSRVGFYGTVTIAFLVAAMRGNDYNIALISLVAGALGAYTVRDIRLRTQIFRSLVFIFLGYSLSILALSIERFESFTTTLTALTFASVNAVISPVLTYGLLLLFERIFKVTTDLTLQELSNLHQPLLQELSEKAPGTFHHSVTLGSLAEAAAEAIGANPILARVGAYYHDIGKILKPEYFMENQAGMPNKHNRLKPRMSALIIASHVKEGMELGRERGLPEVVLNFIPQHHGTTRMSFFYDKALKQAVKKPPKDTINEADFRYPGPKPQTKEAGIVMLADSVEATTRSISDMTPQKLELTIDSVIKKRFLEGQLDECPLTLRDLAKIREAFIKILTGVHHQRIQYPDQKTEQPQIIEEPVVKMELETPTSTLNVEDKIEQEVQEPEEPAQEDAPVISSNQTILPDTQNNTGTPDQAA
jgi:putative nucleotidyltransferase with HDIG domain